jgi:predicted PurR-regulated permease PerM
MHRPRNLFELLANPWARMALEAIGIVLAVWLLHRLTDVVTPLLVGLVVAYMVDPVVNALTRRRFRRSAACNLVYGSGLLAVLALLALSVPVAWHEGVHLYRVAIQGDRWEDADRDGQIQPSELRRDLNRNGRYDASSLTIARRWLEEKGLLKRAEARTDEGEDHDADPGGFDPDEWLRSNYNEITRGLRGVDASNWMARVGGFFASIGWWLALIVLVPIYAYVFSLNLPMVSRTIAEHIPPGQRERTLRILSEINRSVGAFFRGRVLVCAILGAVALVGFAISGVPSFIVLAVLMGLATAIPLAPLLVLLPVAGLLYLDGAATWQYIVAAATYGVIQALEPVLITWIMGRGVEMHPVLVLFSILAFGTLLGPIGVVLAVPMAATLRILVREFLYAHLRRMAGLDEAGDGGASPAARPPPSNAPSALPP